MIKRTIYIGNPAYIHIDKNRLAIENRDSGEVNLLPIEDLGVIELDNPQIIINNYCLAELSKNNVLVNVCGENHHPAGSLWPLDGNVIQSRRIKAQADAPKPLKKNLWKQLVSAKIGNQARLLDSLGKEAGGMREMASSVRSGDPDNKEARASRMYWKELFGPEFRRGRYGKYPNMLLNYAYSVIRAVIARAVVAAGLHPSLGIHHKNQYNSFCLADDLIEPFRPLGDRLVLEVFSEFPDDPGLAKEIKGRLLGLAYVDCLVEGKVSPLSLAAASVCASLVKSYEGESKEIICPTLKD